MSCQREKELADLVDGTCPDGFVEVTISAGMPEPVAPPTRAKMGEGATPDEFELYLCLYGPGEGFVQNWIPTTPIQVHTDPVTGYVTKVDYKAQLPITDEKRVIHLIVNPPAEAVPTLTDYMDNVMEMMVDSDNECSYWQQVILPNGIKSQVVGDKVVVDDETAHPLFDGIADIGVGLAVAVEPDPLRREARGQRRVDLPRGHRVHAHALLGHDAVHLLEGAGLARIQRQRRVSEAVAQGLPVHAAVEADAVLVHQIEGRAVLFRQRRDALSREAQRPVRVACDVAANHDFHRPN
jgi:hypothetical protein